MRLVYSDLARFCGIKDLHLQRADVHDLTLLVIFTACVSKFRQGSTFKLKILEVLYFFYKLAVHGDGDRNVFAFIS